MTFKAALKCSDIGCINQAVFQSTDTPSFHPCEIHMTPSLKYKHLATGEIITPVGVISDPVNHPAHYTFSKYEVADVIEAWGLGWALGSAVKYIARAGRKDPSKEIEDLKKAEWYVRRRIATLERAQNGQT